MARQISMPYQFPPTAMLKPAADSAGRSSNWFDLKNVLKAWIVCHINQGNAATVALTPQQATNVSGGSAKAINASPIWVAANEASSDALVAQAAATSFTTDAGTNDKIVVFEITPDAALDVEDGFCYINIATGASNVANITEATLFVWLADQVASPASRLT